MRHLIFFAPLALGKSSAFWRGVRMASLVSVSVFLGGCVYFNTFYNTRKNFNQAEKDRKSAKSAQGAGAGSYKIAIDKATIVLEKHPSSSYVDDALYIIGVSLYWTEDYFRGERRLRELLAEFPESEYAPRAKLVLANCKLKLNEQAEAVIIFQSILQESDDRDMRTEAAVAIGDFYFEQADYLNAEPFYQMIIDSLGDQNESRRATLKLADSYYARLQAARAKDLYLRALEMSPTPTEFYAANFRIGECSYLKQDIAGGMERFAKLADDQRFFDSIGSVRLQIAKGYENSGDLYLAIEEYEAIAIESPNSRASGSALHNLGLIYQFELQDFEKAQKYYADAKGKGGTLNPYYEESVRREADIGRLAIMRQAAKRDSAVTRKVDPIGKPKPADSTSKLAPDDSAAYKNTTDADSAKGALSKKEQLVEDSIAHATKIDQAALAQLQLADLYLLDLNLPDSASVALRYAVDSFSTSYYAPRALLSLALAHRDQLSDTAAFDSLMLRLLQNYPRSDFYPDALEAVGQRGSARDTGYAAAYYRTAENFYFDEYKVDSAMRYFQFIVDSFPQSRLSPKAAFALLSIREEEFPTGDSALFNAYADFADTYPDDNLGAIAKLYISRPGAPKRAPLHEDKKKPDAKKDSIAEVDSSANAKAAQDSADTAESPFKSGIDTSLSPTLKFYVGPQGQSLRDAPNGPQKRDPIEFIYPSTARNTPDQFEIYFQIQLELDGSVLKAIIKNSSGFPELDQALTEQVANYVFDMGRLGDLSYGDGWFVYKYVVRKPEWLR